MQELGEAINESLSDSEPIAAAIGKIRQAGYDVFLVLEATIGLNKRPLDEEEGEVPLDQSENVEEVSLAEPPKLQWNKQDKKFLRMLRITPR